ncbi:MAG: crossover junction endodeoxyribonuclease RuvC [Candidatus Paceibacterota bacterium]
MKILGIDPGSTRVGYGLIKKDGSQFRFIKSGLLKIVSKDKSHRLLELEKSFRELLEKSKPDIVAIEKLYFVKNMKTGLEVAQSRGVLTLLTVQHKISLLEYTPSEVKLNVAGYGSADKKAVAKMVAKILKIDKISGPDDISDALAVALTAANNYKFDKL